MQPTKITRKRQRLTKINTICNQDAIEIISSDDENKSTPARNEKIIDLTSLSNDNTETNIGNMQDLPDNEEKQLLVSLQIYMCYINMIRFIFFFFIFFFLN